ncbi:hypothetical protein SFA32_12225 [Buttiauxella sp. HR94]|nr:hypothetical protein SFA32_12225 [Buttiauxella sp. HR94]
MTLKIVGVEDAGSIDNERVVFKVSGEPDAIWNYAVLSTPGKPRHAYEDPYATLIEGDKVYLYTGAGTNSVEQNGERKIAHYYWGLNESI